MAKETTAKWDTSHTIKVLSKTVSGTRPGCDRHKRWTTLLTMGGKTVTEYYAASGAARNNVEDAIKAGLIDVIAPKV